MVIPKGVNQIEFYKAAKAKGIKIKSKYEGVCIAKANHSDIVWRAQKWNGKKQLYLGQFPFTEEGEVRASQAYKRYTEGATA